MTPIALIVGLVVTAVIAAGLYAALPRGVRTVLRRGWRGIRRAGRASARSRRRVAVLVAVLSAVAAYMVWPEPWWTASACAAIAFVVAAAAAGRLRLVTSSPATVVALIAAAVPAALPYAGGLGIGLGALAPYVRWAGPVAVLVAALAGATATAGAGFLIGLGGRVSARTVAGGLRVNPDALRPEGEPALRVHADKRTGAVTAGPVPLAHRARMLSSVDLLEQLHPGYSVSVDPAAGTLTFTPTGEDTLAARELLAASGGLVARETPVESTPWRPDAVELRAPDGGWRGGQFAGVEDYAAAGGRTLVQVDLDRGVALAARVPDRVRELRDELAALHGWRPTDLELQVRPGADGRPVELLVHRAPLIDPDRRVEAWTRALTDAVRPASDERWVVDASAGRGRLHATRIPDPLAANLPYDEDPAPALPVSAPWRIGVDEQGDPVTIDLARSAHLLIAGATRSGKSVCTYSLLVHVLRMGAAARLLVADPNDTTIAPFENLVAWSTSETSPDEPTAMLRWVRAEMDRRKPVLRDLQKDKLEVEDFGADLPLLVVVIDEAANYLRHADKKLAQAFRDELMAVVAQGAKYGVRLVLITQRPDSTILDTATRAQLSARISFRVEDQETAKMVFPDLADPAALLRLKPGVGFMREVGQPARRIRAMHLADHWGAAARITNPQPRIDIGSSLQAGTASASSRSDHETVPQEVDLGEMSLSWDDLAGLDLGGHTA